MRIVRLVRSLRFAALLTLAVLVLAACGGGGRAAATPVQLAPTAAPTPTPSATAQETLLRKLPGDATNFIFLDFKAIQNLTGPEGFADGLVSEITQGAGGVLGPAFADSIHGIAGNPDAPTFLISGDFQEFRGPVLQASFAQAASSTESYRGINIYEFSEEGEAFLMAFPDATTWVGTDSRDEAEAVIDRILSGGHVDPAIAEALREIGLATCCLPERQRS